MRIPRDAVAKPLQFLSEKTLTARRGGKVTKMKTYFPEDLWLRDQLVGRYANSGSQLNIFDMSLPPPSGIPVLHKQDGHSYILKEEYNKWKESHQNEKWDKSKTVDWLKYLQGKDLPAMDKMSKGGAKQATTYSLTDGGNYIYVINPNKYPDKHFVVQFTLSSSLDQKKSQRGIASCLSSMTFYSPKKRNDNDKKLSLSSKKGPGKKEWSPEYLASRERVIYNIKNLKGWWYVETENFIMVGNIKNKKTIRELHEGLEKSRNVFSTIFPIKEPLQAVSVAKMFTTRNEYVGYVGNEYQWTGGLWMSDKKELVVSPMDWGSTSERRDMMVNVIQHEGFHQYLYFATGGQSNATWFNEGNATFFEGIEFKGKRAVINETIRLETAKKLVPSADIAGLIKMTQKQYYSNPDRNYPLGYALMFFLHKGAPVMKKKNTYSEIPSKYYEAVIETKDPQKATTIAWKDVDMDEFTKDFREFWSNRNLIKRAIRYDVVKAKSGK